MDERKAKALLEKYLAGEATPAEKEQIDQWFARLVETGEWQWQAEEQAQLQQQMEQHLLQKINDNQAPVRSLLARWRWAAAAVLIILSAGAAYMLTPGKRNTPPVAAAQSRLGHDILPARQQVILTLADGSTRVLDTLSNGAISLQGIEAIKKDGSITYTGAPSETTVFNSITTEKGRTYRLQLSDGTKVWLDAESSIRFPAAFNAQERIVEVNGQAYFEVAAAKDSKGKKQPFKVITDHQQIEVLGTHFNVNAYDRQNILTTLLEGKVVVSKAVAVVAPARGAQQQVVGAQASQVKQLQGAALALSPGQQAAGANGKFTLNKEADIEEVMAWKNGKFQFNGSTVAQIMEQLSRWYSIDVVYKEEIGETFVAEMDRDLPLSQLLELLEMTKQVRFAVEGRKVVVMK